MTTMRISIAHQFCKIRKQISSRDEFVDLAVMPQWERIFSVCFTDQQKVQLCVYFMNFSPVLCSPICYVSNSDLTASSSMI